MNNSKMLPLSNCILSAWPDECFLFSILPLQDNGYAWLINNYVQIIGYNYFDEDIKIFFYPSGRFSKDINALDYCPFITKNQINDRCVNDWFNKFTDFIMYMIDNNYYIAKNLSTVIDPGMSLIRENHVYYIYGYDKINELIYVLDNFERGKFLSKGFSYDSVNMAFNQTLNNAKKEFHHKVQFFELNRFYNEKFSFDVGKLIKYTKGYLESIPLIEYVKKYDDTNRYTEYFGVAVYEMLISFLDVIKNKKRKIDLASFAFLRDEKVMLKERINYLIEHKFLLYEKNIENICNEMIQKQINTIYIGMKYNMTYDIKYIDKIKDNILYIKRNDIYVNNWLLSNINY